MANFVKQPSKKSQSHGGIMAYANKGDAVNCQGKECTKVLTEAEQRFCQTSGIPDLCYDCQRKEKVL